jgi:pilus assembly protein CpaF
MAKQFMEEFNVEAKKPEFLDVNDFESFPNKELLDELRNRIIQSLVDNDIMNYNASDEYIKEQINNTIGGYDLSNVERNYIYNMIDNEVNGYGPITEVLDDPSITEIMINGINEIYIEIDGHVIKDESISFINDDHIVRTVQRMIQPIGRTVDMAHPMVDARLADGSRLNAVLPPLSLNGPVVTIRKFRKELNDIDDFLRSGALTTQMARFLEACVKAKCNMLIVGGTGSGKTTLLNVLSGFISNDERIITIEDAAELRLGQEHVVSLETRVTNYEGEGEVTIRDLVINALRMRPDRIIVGEVRGKEAFDMLQAMNTGHSGSMTTMHANGPADALNRLETMILMAGMEIPIKAIREYIENAIDIVVNVERLSDGRRKVTSISEVVGFDNDIIMLKEIFQFKKKDLTKDGEVAGEFLMHKYKPKVYNKISSAGIHIVDDIFGNGD